MTAPDAFGRVLEMGARRLREMDDAARMAPPQDRGADALAWAALKSFLGDVAREAAATIQEEPADALRQP